MGEAKKSKKKISGWFIPLFIIGGLVAVFAIIGFINQCLNWSLDSYIDTFTPVAYTEKIEAVKEDGYYTFTTDKDLKIMQITDTHLGGGFISYKKDKMAINCVITMLQNEKPDLVVTTGDNVFAVPYISGTINNKMVSKTFIHILEHMGVTYTTTFGNHDSEVFDYYDRGSLSKLFSKKKYEKSIYDVNNKIYGESNQVIVVKNSDGLISKCILTLDSNAYVNNSLKSVLDWTYDYIRDDQVDWAKSVINSLSKKNQDVISSMSEAKKSSYNLDNFTTVKTLLFIHIPISEYAIAFEELRANSFADTTDSKYISGVNDEEDYEGIGNTRIWYGGSSSGFTDISTIDKTFEVLSGEIDSLQAVFCGHDHVNNALLEYKGVYLSYGYSIDYLAYSNIDKSGLQRGNTTIFVHSNGNFSSDDIHHNNYYNSGYVFEHGVEEVDLTNYYYSGNELPKA